MKEEFKGSILYELICCSEWKDEKEEDKPLMTLPEKCGSVISRVNPTSFMKHKTTVQDTVTWLLSLGPWWKFANTPDGKIIAILGTTTLETRSDRDNFSSSIGKNNVIKDLYPNFRCMTWNQDGSLLAVSLTNGQILFFDIMATQICVVRMVSQPTTEDMVFTIDNALSGLFFVEDRVKKAAYPNELIAVDRRGTIKSYREINSDTMQLHHEVSFRRYYPHGTTAVTFSRANSIVLVCGVIEIGKDLTKSKEKNLAHGITAWRLLNDHPYYRIVFTVPQQELRIDSRNLWKMAYSILHPTSKSDDAIFRVSLSPNEKFAIALHTTGTISVWNLPSLKLHQLWPLKSQFQHNAENSRFNNQWRVAFNRSRSKPIDPWRFHPFDINWWNDESVIVSRSNGCVSLCSVNEHVPSKNLLGDSPELFESPVYISQRFDKGFFAFECDLKMKGEDLNDSSNSMEVDLPSNFFWIKVVYQEVLFWMTDSERFRPPRKRKRKIRTWIETNRLFNVRSITPVELFYRKIDAEEYGEALDLAKVYKLDSDLVYQRRWTKHPVTSRSIKDILAKITKRNWVLQECLERVPDDIDAARQLLEFGLKGTDLTAAVTISQGRDKGRFILWAPDDLDISEDEYLSLIDRNNLEVKRLVGYRKQFLHFLDMLNTYEMMVGGHLLSDSNYDRAAYSKLRNRSVLESCIDMARNSDITGLKIMLTNHWAEISPFYLLALSSFCETTSPHNYRDFLPELTQDGQVLLWDEIASKEKDWSDGFNVADPDAANDLAGYEEPHTAEFICSWYENRAKEIESMTGLTNLALELSRLGVDRNIKNMRNMVENLETVELLVYEIGIEDMSLKKLEQLSNIERLQLLMSTATEESFVDNFKIYALPFLAHCDRREPGSKFFLMNKYLTDMSQVELKLPLKIFENSKREVDDPIISDICDLMKLAYNCIYACKNPKQNEIILALLGCLPDRGFGNVNNTELSKLHDSIDELELHYHAVQILEKYNLPYSLKRIQNMEDKLDEISKFFEKLCHGASKKDPPMKVNEWKTLLYDMLELQKKIFHKFDVTKCYMTYVAALLRSGHADVIKLAKNFLDKTPTEVETDERGNLKITRRNSSAYSTSFALYLYLIPYEESLGMVLEAAEIYFDSASNYSDPDMELAKVCLNLMENSKEPNITLMFDRIDAVKVLNKDFNLNILPQSVRRCQDRTGLLKRAIENVKEGYKKTQQLLKLSMFLRTEELDEQNVVEGAVLEMVGEAGLAASDIKFCTQICHNIMAKGYQTGWNVFTQVAKFQKDLPILDHETRLAFINYALNSCPNHKIFEVLNAKYVIESRSIKSPLTDSFLSELFRI